MKILVLIAALGLAGCTPATADHFDQPAWRCSPENARSPWRGRRMQAAVILRDDGKVSFTFRWRQWVGALSLNCGSTE